MYAYSSVCRLLQREIKLKTLYVFLIFWIMKNNNEPFKSHYESQ